MGHFAAVRDAINAQRARNDQEPLTSAQERQLKLNLTTIAMAKETHADSRTYGGANTESQREADAGNLRAAANADAAVARENLIASGHPASEVDAALKELHSKNRSAGVYKKEIPSALWGGG